MANHPSCIIFENVLYTKTNKTTGQQFFMNDCLCQKFNMNNTEISFMFINYPNDRKIKTQNTLNRV